MGWARVAEQARGSGRDGRTQGHGAIAARVSQNVARQLRQMRRVLGDSADPRVFAAVEASALASIGRIGDLMRSGEIAPWLPVRSSLLSPRPPAVPRVLRVGVFPTAADPLHWVHLLSGLEAMERLALDRVVYVIAGGDVRKPLMSPEALRHRMAASVLRLFAPLFEYSPIALGGSLAGEDNLFRFLALNAGQPIHAFYIAGGDHYQRANPSTGEPDTIARIERAVASRSRGYSPEQHQVSIVFLPRGQPVGDIETSLPVHWLDRPVLDASSTSIREALAGRGSPGRLATMPFAAFDFAWKAGLYRGTPEAEPGAPASGASLAATA